MSQDNTFDLGSLVAACRDLAKQSGKLISTLYEKGDLQVVDKLFGDNKKLTSVKDILKVVDPTTVADEMAQKMIIGSLKKLYPKLDVRGEEGDLKIENDDIITPDTTFDNDKQVPTKYNSIKIEELVVWVDPIDGTKEFTEGIKSAVTTLIGVAWNGRPIAGVIGRPFTGEVIWGIVGLGSFGFKNKDKLKKRKAKLRRVICTSRSHFKPSMKAYVSACKPTGFERSGGSGGKVLMVIEGAADAYVFPSRGTKKWDTCAPEAVLLALGGKLTKPNGDVYEYNPNKIKAMNEEGFIATVFGDDYHSTFLENNLNLFQLDLILFGATGFTGKLATEHIINHYIYTKKRRGSNKNENEIENKLNFGIAGRNKVKLQNVIFSIKNECKYDDDIKKQIDERITIIECDTNDLQSVESMVQKTSVIISTVGPYAKYGENVIKSCCKYGVDYVDLTGEFPWVKRMILKYGEEAIRSHSRIINFGGAIAALTDCAIYSGIKKLKEENKDDHDAVAITSIKPGMIIGRGGGSSGGTIASWLYSIRKGGWKYDQNAAYFLCDNDDYASQLTISQPNYGIIKCNYNSDLKKYETPFIYGGVQRMIFMRSNELLNYYYNKNVQIYRNIMFVKSKLLAIILSFFIYIIPILLTWSCIRSCLVKLIKSISFKPGDGPNKKDMIKSNWREIIEINGIKVNSNKNNLKLQCQVDIKIIGDYGYLNTSKLLVEQGVICALERNNPSLRNISGGFLTPAAAFKDKLPNRLDSNLKEFEITYKMIHDETNK